MLFPCLTASTKPAARILERCSDIAGWGAFKQLHISLTLISPSSYSLFTMHSLAGYQACSVLITRGFLCLLASLYQTAFQLYSFLLLFVYLCRCRAVYLVSSRKIYSVKAVCLKYPFGYITPQSNLAEYKYLFIPRKFV